MVQHLQKRKISDYKFEHKTPKTKKTTGYPVEHPSFSMIFTTKCRK